MHGRTISIKLSFFLDTKLTTQVEIVSLCYVQLALNYRRSTLIIPLLLNLQSVEAHEDAFLDFFTIS